MRDIEIVLIASKIVIILLAAHVLTTKAAPLRMQYLVVIYFLDFLKKLTKASESGYNKSLHFHLS